jgi:superoxide dismutase, Fe-Mn family
MNLNRRIMLAAGSAVLAASLAKPHIAFGAAPFEQPPLPYAQDALAPTISSRTVGLHYGKHHKGYFDKLNKLAAGTPYSDMSLEEVIRASKTKGDQAIFNNASQAWNHNFYWRQFSGGSAPAPDHFIAMAVRDYGGIDQLKEKIVSEADQLFGSGWVWLVKDGNKLAILRLQNAGNPIAESKHPLLGIDVWEHAYYLDYENRRTEHVKAVLSERVNWHFVGEQASG